jgi:hypothetical protein
MFLYASLNFHEIGFLPQSKRFDLVRPSAKVERHGKTGKVYPEILCILSSSLKIRLRPAKVVRFGATEPDWI